MNGIRRSVVLLMVALVGLIRVGVINASYTGGVEDNVNGLQPHISITISARLRLVELSWSNILDFQNATILVTNTELPPHEKFVRIEHPIQINDDHKYYVENSDDVVNRFGADFATKVVGDHHRPSGDDTTNSRWFGTSNNAPVLCTLSLNDTRGWRTTNLMFDYRSSRNVTVNSKCYGYWATLVWPDGRRIAETCVRAYPRWMNEMRGHVGAFRMRELFLVGTHDSGSYRNNFNPQRNETRVSKYTLTQDEDILSQLMHGVRYLDIRVGNYRKETPDSPQFWVNHGISRQQPLDDVLRQVRDFVTETNEIVIFDVQEFPVGFDKLAKHRQLVYHLHTTLGDLLCSPKLTWNATLAEIWRRGGLVILSYDHRLMVEEFGDILFQSVQQRWGNAQSLVDLERHLAPTSREFTANYMRPIADMAEMTPTAWDVFSDKHRGLRRMADLTNREVSRWYSEDWQDTTNIVAVDFFRGTTLMEVSMRAIAKRLPEASRNINDGGGFVPYN